jgi:hypothetical protein
MTIVQIYEPRVFTAGIALLETIITVLDTNDAFKGILTIPAPKQSTNIIW